MRDGTMLPIQQKNACLPKAVKMNRHNDEADLA